MSSEEYARFAEASYDMLGSASKPDRVGGINEKISDTGFKVDSDKSNRDMLYLVNDTTGEHHISLRGTATKQDIVSDANIATGTLTGTKEFKKRNNRVKKYVKEIPEDAKFTMSGHSLGGMYNQTILSKSKNVRDRVDEVHTFNSAANPLVGEARVGKTKKKQLDQKVIHHRTTDDIVSKPFEINVPFGKVQTYKTQPMSMKTRVPLKLAGVFNTVQAYHAHKLDHFY
jgi:hypothetical protein